MNEAEWEIHEARRTVRQFWEWANLCQCGQPETIVRIIHGALIAHSEPGPHFEGGPDARLMADPLTMFVLYAVDAWGLTDHGGGIGGAWLSDDGIRLRDALAKVNPETVFDEDWWESEGRANSGQTLSVGEWKTA
jgi:hypothetical protein